jgi:tripeptide aminopeptidase
VVAEMVDALSAAASDSECDVETSVQRRFQGYRLTRTERAVEVAAEALRERGIEPTFKTTGGGSDANALIPAGLTVVNLANGTDRNHQPDESVTIDALETMLEVTVSLVEQTALIARQETLG